MSAGLEILTILLLALFNGLLSMSEIAIVSARKVRLRQRAEDGDRGARAALELAGEPGRFLSTVQIGITLVGIVAGVFGGATLADRLSLLLARWPPLGPHADTVAVALVVLAITYLTLVLGELVPKQVAMSAPETIAAFMARPLDLLSRIARPVVFVLDRSAQLVLRLLPRQRAGEPPITEEELHHLLRQGTRAGVFEPGEQEIVDRVVRLGEKPVGEIATPRAAVVALDAAASSADNLKRVADSSYLVFPVYDGAPDRLLGVVTVKDLWREAHAGREPDLRALVREPLYLPENVSALRALERIRTTGRQTAVVLDEHGGIDGLVTLHDVLEALVGALPNAADLEPLIVEREDGSWLADGLVELDELAKVLGTAPGSEAWSSEAHTLGGWVMERLARLPKAGDRFEWQGLRLEVVDMDGRRVDQVLIQRQQPRADRGATAVSP